MDWGVHAILRMLSSYEFDEVLDIGSGAGEHQRFFELFSKQVYSIDIDKQADYVGDFMEVDFDKQFQAIWCSHVLEHQRNVGLFLDKIYDVLADDGVLAITVPLHQRETMIAGHLTSWSIPLLCYNLVMAGFDCVDADILSIYELSLIVRKHPAEHSEWRKQSALGIEPGKMPLEHIAGFFPYEVNQGATVSGTGYINWGGAIDHYVLPAPVKPVSGIDIQSKNFNDNPGLRPNILFQ